MASRPHRKIVPNESFDTATIQAVWEKGAVIPGINPNRRRKDSRGTWIDRDGYGVRIANGTGWEIDHIDPAARGDIDDLDNLQPLQWENDRDKGDRLSSQ
ncbi:MAG: HNH endonuclease [Nitrospirae bacterium]|nr:HNH endonuclease [Nitrospirota bacterium]